MPRSSGALSGWRGLPLPLDQRITSGVGVPLQAAAVVSATTCVRLRVWSSAYAAAQAYVKRLEELSGARISVIGVGPGRDENVVINDLIG